GTLVDLPADNSVGAGRAGVVALRRPHHPFAVGAAEQRDDQFTGLEVPQADGLVAAAGEEVAAVGRGRHGPNVALVPYVVPEALTLEVVGGENTVVAAGDDGLSIGRKGVGAVRVAIGWSALDGGDYLSTFLDVEDCLKTIGATLTMHERAIVVDRAGAD